MASLLNLLSKFFLLAALAAVAYGLLTLRLDYAVCNGVANLGIAAVLHRLAGGRGRGVPRWMWISAGVLTSIAAGWFTLVSSPETADLQRLTQERDQITASIEGLDVATRGADDELRSLSADAAACKRDVAAFEAKSVGGKLPKREFDAYTKALNDCNRKVDAFNERAKALEQAGTDASAAMARLTELRSQFYLLLGIALGRAGLVIVVALVVVGVLARVTGRAKRPPSPDDLARASVVWQEFLEQDAMWLGTTVTVGPRKWSPASLDDVVGDGLRACQTLGIPEDAAGAALGQPHIMGALEARCLLAAAEHPLVVALGAQVSSAGDELVERLKAMARQKLAKAAAHPHVRPRWVNRVRGALDAATAEEALAALDQPVVLAQALWAMTASAAARSGS